MLVLYEKMMWEEEEREKYQLEKEVLCNTLEEIDILNNGVK